MLVLQLASLMRLMVVLRRHNMVELRYEVRGVAQIVLPNVHLAEELRRGMERATAGSPLFPSGVVLRGLPCDRTRTGAAGVGLHRDHAMAMVRRSLIWI